MNGMNLYSCSSKMKNEEKVFDGRFSANISLDVVFDSQFAKLFFLFISSLGVRAPLNDGNCLNIIEFLS